MRSLKKHRHILFAEIILKTQGEEHTFTDIPLAVWHHLHYYHFHHKEHKNQEEIEATKEQ